MSWCIPTLDIGNKLRFFQTPNISKAPILEATRDFGRKLKIKYFLRSERNNFDKPNWVPTDKGTDPDLLECLNKFTKEIDKLNVLRQKLNLTV
jgi:hypothetical protein